MPPEARLRELGIELPAPPRPVATYVPVARVPAAHGRGVASTGDAVELAFVSGMVPIDAGRLLWTGKVGRDVDVDEATHAARRCALQALAALREELGTLDRVVSIVRVGVFVASAEGFTGQSGVANGASDVLVDVFGDAGRHARVAVGVPELPLGAPVEVELLAVVSAG